MTAVGRTTSLSSSGSGTAVVPKSSYSTSSESVTDKLSFQHLDMLRGVRFSKVQHRFGRLLQTNDDGSGDPYRLSTRVQRLAAFISHNWGVQRRLAKFVCLALHFNANKAIAATMSVVSLTTSVTAAGLVPLVEGSYAHGHGMVVSIPVLIYTLLMGHMVGSGVPTLDPVIFLDKACICQTNPSLKEQGIKKLAAFLRHSDSLVMLYTDSYLARLWTTYELGTFLALGRACHVHIIPIHFPVFAAVSIVGPAISFFAVRVIFYVDESKPVQVFTGTATVLIASIVVVVFRAWAHAKSRISKAVDGFDIKKVKCSEESDRPVIETNIISFMKYFNRVSINGDDEVLNAFNIEVKVAMRDVFATAVSGIGWPYRVLFLGSLVLWINHMDRWSADVALGNRAGRNAILTCISYTSFCLLVYPLLLAVISLMARKCLGLSLLPEVLYCIVVLVVSVLLGLSTNPTTGILKHLSDAAVSSNVWLAVFSVFHASIFCCTRLVYGQACWRQYFSNDGTDALDALPTCEGAVANFDASSQVAQPDNSAISSKWSVPDDVPPSAMQPSVRTIMHL